MDLRPQCVFPTHPQINSVVNLPQDCEATNHLLLFFQLYAMMIQEAKAAVYRTMPMLLIKTLNILYARSVLPQLGSSYCMYCPSSYICRTYSSVPLAPTFWYYTVLIAYVHTRCSNAARM